MYKCKDSGWEKLVGMDEIYKSYPTETQNDATEVYTDIGADGIPVFEAVAIVTAGSGDVILRHLGKNLFDPNTEFANKIQIGEYGEELASTYWMSSDYIPVQPNTVYTFLNIATPGSGSSVLISFYNADKEFIERFKSLEKDKDPTFTTPDGCYYIRVSASNARYNNNNGQILFTYKLGGVTYNRPVQLERGASATHYAPYSAKDVTIRVNGEEGYEFDPLPTTMLGDNTYRLLPDEGIAATLDMIYRVDPTLAYNKLKAAIVAAGTT
jgi:hypothetical protein